MPADLHIHIFEGIDENDLSTFFVNTLGSKYFNRNARPNRKASEDAYDRVSSTASVWIGEVSRLKAGLFDDPETFVPGTVQRVQKLIGEDLPVLNDKLIVEIMEAFLIENTTGYSLNYIEYVLSFLVENKGKKVFTVSW